MSEPQTAPMTALGAWRDECELGTPATAGNALAAWLEHFDGQGWSEGGGTITWIGDDAGNPWLVPASGTDGPVRSAAMACTVSSCQRVACDFTPDYPDQQVRLRVAEVVIDPS